MSETIYFIEGRPVFPSFEQQASYRYLCRHPPFDGRSSPAFDAGFANPTAACPYRSSSFAAARFHAGQTVARDFGDRATATPGTPDSQNPALCRHLLLSLRRGIRPRRWRI